MKTYKRKCDELRDNGGILKDKDGSFYFKPGYIYHREDGPAVEYMDGSKYWCINGNSHKEDGPAITYPNGAKFWYYNNNWIMKTCGDVTKEQLLDYRLKIL